MGAEGIPVLQDRYPRSTGGYAATAWPSLVPASWDNLDPEYQQCLAQARAQAVAIDGPNLPLLHRVAILIYTSSAGWYAEINRQLREQDVTPAVAEFAQLLTAAVETLIPFEGTVYRGIAVPDLDSFLLDYEPGLVVTWRSFTSTTRDPERAFFGNVLFIIEAKNARLLGHYSATPELEEALFSPGARFRVVAVERNGDDAVIELQEV